MPTIIVTTRAGEERTVQAATGHSLMEGLRNGGIDEIQALCGGCGACCTCHVYIEAERLAEMPAMSEQEDALLDSSDVRIDRSRLSCQIPVTESLEGLRLSVAPEF
jgi:2Fe-2S ferredoxin